MHFLLDEPGYVIICDMEEFEITVRSCDLSVRYMLLFANRLLETTGFIRKIARRF